MDFNFISKVIAMIISIPKRASSFNTYYSDEWSNAMTEEEMCSECSSGSSWPLSISTDEEHGRERHEAITLREAVAARKTRIPNDEASVGDSSISLRIPTKLGRTEIDTMCECVLCDSKIVTFSEESELHIKLPRTSLQKSYTFEETVAQILQG
jgi:hypothetical protein